MIYVQLEVWHGVFVSLQVLHGETGVRAYVDEAGDCTEYLHRADIRVVRQGEALVIYVEYQKHDHEKDDHEEVTRIFCGAHLQFLVYMVTFFEWILGKVIVQSEMGHV